MKFKHSTYSEEAAYTLGSKIRLGTLFRVERFFSKNERMAAFLKTRIIVTVFAPCFSGIKFS